MAEDLSWMLPYRSMDEAGSPTAAAVVGREWIEAIAFEEAARDPDALHIERPDRGGGASAIALYRGTELLALATIFRDPMNFSVLIRWRPLNWQVRLAIALVGNLGLSDSEAEAVWGGAGTISYSLEGLEPVAPAGRPWPIWTGLDLAGMGQDVSFEVDWRFPHSGSPEMLSVNVDPAERRRDATPRSPKETFRSGRRARGKGEPR
jgi:hypothetical protein